MIRNILAWALFVALPVASTSAQTYRDSGGTVIPGVAAIPFPFAPVPPGQHNLAPTSPTTLSVPPGARYATVCASNTTVRYTTDGVTAPTNAIGMPLFAGACLTLSGAPVLANFTVISAMGTLDVEYFK